MTSIADFLHEKIEVDLSGRIVGVNLFEAPKQNRIRAERVESINRCLEIPKNRDRRDDQHDDIRSPQNLPRMLTIFFEHRFREFIVIFWTARSNRIEIFQKKLYNFLIKYE